MSKANTASVKMDKGLKNTFLATIGQKEQKTYIQNQQAKNEVNASKGQKSAAQKKKAKAKAKTAKQSKKKRK